MKYVVAALAAVFLVVAVQPADAARARAKKPKVVPYAKLSAWGQFERSLQCSSRANEAKLPLSKRGAFVDKCKNGRA